MTTSKRLSLTLLALLVSGCQSGSSVKIWSGETVKPVHADSNTPTDYNIPLLSKTYQKPFIEYTGKAAEIIAQSQADNSKTKQAMLGDTFKFSGVLFLILMIAMVGGIIFGALTRSRFGWIIPAACAVGIAMMEFFIQSAAWINIAITAGVLALGIGLLVWKAIEYHKERDLEIKKNATAIKV